jgi:hypothetical protein
VYLWVIYRCATVAETSRSSAAIRGCSSDREVGTE